MRRNTRLTYTCLRSQPRLERKDTGARSAAVALLRARGALGCIRGRRRFLRRATPGIASFAWAGVVQREKLWVGTGERGGAGLARVAHNLWLCQAAGWHWLALCITPRHLRAICSEYCTVTACEPKWAACCQRQRPRA
jgi:hypothetical protein